MVPSNVAQSDHHRDPDQLIREQQSQSLVALEKSIILLDLQDLLHKVRWLEEIHTDLPRRPRGPQDHQLLDALFPPSTNKENLQFRVQRRLVCPKTKLLSRTKLHLRKNNILKEIRVSFEHIINYHRRSYYFKIN